MAALKAINREELIIQNRVADYYEEIRYKRYYSRAYHEWWVRKMVSYLSREGVILDNGCGSGILFSLLRWNSMFGLDISWNMLRKAKHRNPRVILGDSHHLPFGAANFDAVFCRGLLHHLDDPMLGITETYRVLKPGGEAVFVDTNESIVSKIPRLLAKKGHHFSGCHKNFNKADYVRMIRSIFRVEKIVFFGYIAYPLLGFPDVIDVFRFLPMKHRLYKLLIRMDEFISNIPLFGAQGWAILVKGIKPIHTGL